MPRSRCCYDAVVALLYRCGVRVAVAFVIPMPLGAVFALLLRCSVCDAVIALLSLPCRIRATVTMPRARYYSDAAWRCRYDAAFALPLDAVFALL